MRDLTVSGNVYVLPIKNVLGQIMDLQVLDPRSMTVCTDKYGEILKYIQRVGADVEVFESNQIYHLVETYDPDNEILGLSRIESLIYDVM